MLILSCVLVNLKSSCQRELVKTLSLSEINVSGKPCNLKILSMNATATWKAVKGCFNGMKWAHLENLSTTTNMQFSVVKLATLQ